MHKHSDESIVKYVWLHYDKPIRFSLSREINIIKFFRNIRQKLPSQGKTGNYLKYAFGEIVLVVIGILIALQINNWNEKTKLENSIDSHLEILKQNLIEDEIQLVRLKENITKRKQSADAAMLQMMTIRPVDIQLKKYLIM